MHVKYRLLCVWVLMVLPHRLLAQSVTGLVIERNTRLPLASAIITTASGKAYTNSAGIFKILYINTGDSVNIVHAGFKPYRFSYRSQANNDTLKIIMEPVSLMLNEVSVRANRNLNVDSVNNRAQFSRVFNHKAIGIQDIFINNAKINSYKPYDNVTAPNSTTTILSVNLLQAISKIGDKQSKTTKLQKELIANEQFNYAGQRFSRQKINALTGLKGDSLRRFTEKYQLGLGDTQKMTDYDMMIYIKKSYAEFVKR